MRPGFAPGSANTLMENREPVELNANTYCPECGYCLRGLLGDPVCCPECGEHYDRTDLQIPEEIHSRCVRRIESASTICVVAMWGFLVGGVITFVGWKHIGTLLWGSALLLWVITIQRFRKKCGFRIGWFGVLCWYHLAGLFWASIIAGVGLATNWVYGVWGERGTFILLTLIILSRVALDLINSRSQHCKLAGPYAMAKQQLIVFCRRVAFDQFHRTKRRI